MLSLLYVGGCIYFAFRYHEERKKRAAEKQRAKLREGKAEAKKQLKRGLDAIERLADE